MSRPIDEEIRRLKNDLARKREEITRIENLAGREIDRDFLTDAVGLSERELDPFFAQAIEEIKGHLAIKPDTTTFTSHRRLLGRFVLSLKRKYILMTRFYMDPILEQQELFNRQSLDLQLASLSRLRRLNDQLRDIEVRLGHCEEELAIIRNKIKDEGKTQTPKD